MKVAALCCTHGRYKCLQRSVKCFLDQDYEGDAIMFIANSGDPLFWKGSSYIIFDVAFTDLKNSEVICSHVLNNKLIVIWNMPTDCYDSVGEKYTLALNKMLERFPNIDVVYSHDDDDIYLPNHISEGVIGMIDAYMIDRLAYKPQYSYYRSQEGIIKNENTYEPSIFVDAKYLKEKGYAPVSVKYHQQWLDPLIAEGNILVDPEGPSTFIYNWGDPWETYKMSGTRDDTIVNMYAHKRRSKDMGDGILTPNLDNSMYYKEVELVK